MLNKKRLISLSSAIKEAQILAMKKDKNVLLIGLGVDDPKGIFGTTKGVNKIFKKGEQVFDFPTAENAMTGIAIGASISGKKPIIVHQRVEFSLLSVEQIINPVARLLAPVLIILFLWFLCRSWLFPVKKISNSTRGMSGGKDNIITQPSLEQLLDGM